MSTKKCSIQITLIMKIMIVIISCILLVLCVTVYCFFKDFSLDQKTKPRPVKNIEDNKVYVGGAYKHYPLKYTPREYIKFNTKSHTYVLMYDDSRCRQSDYNQDGDGSQPEINIYFGEYKIKDGMYILTIKESANVGFEDVDAVKNKKINSYYPDRHMLEKNLPYVDGHGNERIILRESKGEYKLGYRNNDGTLNKHFDNWQFLYISLDIKNLPNTLEEFRNQYTIDDEAYKRHLKKLNR